MTHPRSRRKPDRLIVIELFLILWYEPPQMLQIGGFHKSSRRSKVLYIYTFPLSLDQTCNTLSKTSCRQRPTVLPRGLSSRLRTPYLL